MFVCKFYSMPEQRQTRCEAGTQSFRSEANLQHQIAELPAVNKACRHASAVNSPSLPQKALRYKSERAGPNMRICGKQIVLVALSAFVLAACGGGPQSTSGGAGNLPPIIQGAPVTTVAAGASYSFTPKAADPDGNKLTFDATGVPAWARFDSATGALAGTPTEADVGTSGMITIEVSDSMAVTQLPGFQISVTSNATVPPPANNSPPTIAGTPGMSATVGQVYTFTPVASDPDNDTLIFSIDNKPSWATFTSATGELRGTPATGDVGSTNNIMIHVSDGTTSVDLPSFNLQVVASAPANRPPTITGTPAASVTVGQAYSFRPVASDPDGNTLLFSIQNLPAWATFSTTTGRIAGTPTAANVGASARITISVSDGTVSTSLPSFTIQVNAAANRAPTISGSPQTSVTVAATYSFQPSATDADGDTLTFRVDNKPAWASFSTSTGRLSGTPGSADVGSFANIVISVSDGTASVSLTAFAIAVQQAATGNATVSWTPPTTNTDGSTLTDLTGFRIAYGNASAALDQSISVTNAGLTSYTVNNLGSGQWFFAVFAVNSAGIESDISNVASKTIQ